MKKISQIKSRNVYDYQVIRAYGCLYTSYLNLENEDLYLTQDIK